MFKKYISTKIIPVAVVETEEEIRNIADLSSEYLPAIELTMRTEYSYKALEILAKYYPNLPRAAAPSEIEQCLSYGHKYLKFFHAGVFGGIEWLKGVGAVYSHTKVKFMPLGGVSIDNVLEYLKQPNVFACGGSWLCSRDILKEKNWTEMKNRFKKASELIR